MLRLSSFTADKGALNQVFCVAPQVVPYFSSFIKAAPFLSHCGSVEFCVEPNLAQIVICAKSLVKLLSYKILYSTAKNVTQYSYTGILHLWGQLLYNQVVLKVMVTVWYNKCD